MGFETDLPLLLNYAKKIIKTNAVPLEPEDLINEAFLRLATKEQEYKLQIFKNAMFSYLLDERKVTSSFIRLDHKSEQAERSNENEITCTKCHQSKAATCFPLRFRKSNGQYYREFCCKDCQDKRVTNWIAKNKAAHITNVIKYQKKQCENLAPVYIKTLLKKLNIPITPENVLAKRQSLLQKRAARNEKLQLLLAEILQRQKERDKTPYYFSK